ncbi:hypothetical protein AAIB41_11570 [Brucella sp. BE17]|uniref:hypothetical protein n=1 Tax=Brucella sp. BE17 TaxID=3142977 RepID=UPI0031B9CD17
MRSRFIMISSVFLLALPAAAEESNWQAEAIRRALDYHAANLPALCVTPEETEMEPASYELQVGEDTAARQALIVEFPCQFSAYSQTAVYLLSDQRGTVSEIVFPTPKFDLTYTGEGSDATVEKVVIYETPYRREIANGQYDPSSRTMVERNNWRELQDAHTETHWTFKNGKFEIVYFAVDATFDGEDNPIVVLKRDIW